MELPASLKPIKPFMEQGAKLRTTNPIVSYYAYLHALQEAMAMRAKLPKQDMGFIMSLMDQVEAHKKEIGEVDSPAVQVETFALDLFQAADDSDRAGNHGLQTAKDFLAAANLMEACKQFGELPEDLSEKSKYGKWRFVELCKAAKERRAPLPPRGDPSDGSGETDLLHVAPPPSEGSAGGSPVPVPSDGPWHYAPPGGGTSGPPPSYMDLPPAAPSGMPQVGASAQSSFDVGAVPSVPSVPSVPTSSMHAPPTYAPPAQPMPVANPAFKPSTPAMLEAARLCQSAASNLQFQDHETAINTLAQALKLLTTPPPGGSPLP